MLLQGEQKGDGLVDFAAVLSTAASQYYCKFFHISIDLILEAKIQSFCRKTILGSKNIVILQRQPAEALMGQRAGDKHIEKTLD
jgi:hypothetical protein